jgi:threonine synthase
MRYVSVKTGMEAGSFRDALLRGMAPDGSLYVPVELPRLHDSFWDAIDERSLHEIGYSVISGFIDDIPADDLRGILERAWTFPIPLVRLDDGIRLLELYHGPTLAFKDVGARFLSVLLDYYMRREQRHISIMVATSGDTGSAVAHGFYGAENISVFVVYPSGRISALQEKQMATLGGNVHAIEVQGTFDECQRLVKQALNDERLQRERSITTANSINLGRLIPQIVYYIWGYAQWRRNTGGTGSDRAPWSNPLIVVPSGNFGNLTAGLYAHRMGMPAEKFIAATNRNDVVPEYLRTGVYTPRESVSTWSNAMDVGDPSNWSRIESLFEKDYNEILRSLEGLAISDEETLEEIRSTYEATGYIADPHTAVGIAAARRRGDGEYMIAATAHPAKFQDIIKRAIGIEIDLPPALAKYIDLPKKSSVIPAEYDSLKEIVIRTANGI